MADHQDLVRAIDDPARLRDGRARDSIGYCADCVTALWSARSCSTIRFNARHLFRLERQVGQLRPRLATKFEWTSSKSLSKSGSGARRSGARGARSSPAWLTRPRLARERFASAARRPACRARPSALGVPRRPQQRGGQRQARRRGTPPAAARRRTSDTDSSGRASGPYNKPGSLSEYE